MIILLIAVLFLSGSFFYINFILNVYVISDLFKANRLAGGAFQEFTYLSGFQLAANFNFVSKLFRVNYDFHGQEDTKIFISAKKNYLKSIIFLSMAAILVVLKVELNLG